MTENMMDKYYAKREKDKARGFVDDVDIAWAYLSSSGLYGDSIVLLLAGLTGESEEYIRFLGKS